MLKRLAELAKQGKEIWGFLALVVGLGVSYGKLSSRLDGLDRDVGKVERSIAGLRREMGRQFEQVDGRFERAHDTIERRLGASDLLVMGLRDTVTRLVVLDEVRSHQAGLPTNGIALAPTIAPLPPPGQPPIQDLPPGLQVKRAHQDLRDSVRKVMKQQLQYDGDGLPSF